MWKYVYTTFAEGRHQDVHFKLLHRITVSKHYVSTRFKGGHKFKGMNVSCKTCRGTIETNEHIFFDCKNAKAIWTFVYPTVQKIMYPDRFKIPSLILGDFPQKTPFKKINMCLSLLQVAIHAIWENRNYILFEQKHRDKALTIGEGVIYGTFCTILKRKFNEFRPNGLNKFRELYCHTPEVCEVLGNDQIRVHML